MKSRDLPDIEVTNIESVLKRARVLFFLLGIILLGLAWVPVINLWKYDVWNVMWKDFQTEMIKIESNRVNDVTPTPYSEKLNVQNKVIINNTVTTVNDVKQISPVLTPTKTIVRPTQVQKQCYRYTVTHLDGSTSNLCYAKSDYDVLVNVGYKYSSAKTFYEFQLESAEKYQDEYERTGSSIYLDAKASSEGSAAREKGKMESAVGEMQEIEKRGF